MYYRRPYARYRPPYSRYSPILTHLLGPILTYPPSHLPPAPQLSTDPVFLVISGDRDEKKAGQEAGDADEAPEAEEKEAGGASWEVAPIYRHPRAPSVREEEEDVDDVPLSGEYIRSKLAGRVIHPPAHFCFLEFSCHGLFLFLVCFLLLFAFLSR